MTEDQIRDMLADDLEIIEKGLRLKKKEFMLKNTFGTKGFIDILAIDEFGNHVIIEIKKSKSVSREAIHEIFKYIALFQLENGVPIHKLRAIVVSLDWSELIVPFSEFKKVSGYQVSGYQIVMNGDKILKLEEINSIEIPEGIILNRHHDIYLFKNKINRDSSIEKIINVVNVAGVGIGLILTVDYSGCDEKVVFPHGIYVALGNLEKNKIDQIEKKLREDGDISDLSDDVESKLLIEQEFSRICFDSFCEHDDYEIGYPEKFFGMLDGWEINDLNVVGRISEGFDCDIPKVKLLIGGLEGQNQIKIVRFSSPRLNLAWKDILTSLEMPLMGNDVWQKNINDFLNFIEEKFNSSKICIDIFNPMNILIWIYKVIVGGDTRYIPIGEIVVADDDGYRFSLVCFVGQKKLILKEDISKILDNLKVELFDYVTMYHFGSQWEIDQDIMKELGLYYGTSIVFKGSKGNPCSIRYDGGIPIYPFCGEKDGRRWFDLQEFIKSRNKFVTSFVSSFEQMTIGL